MTKLSDNKVQAVTSQNYTGVAAAGQTVIIPGFTWRTTWTGKALYISGVKQAPDSYTINSMGGGLSSQITLPEALVGGETIDFTALDVSAVPSLQGIVDTLALQPTQITNAGFGVWSNGTIESAVSSINLITNGEFEIDISSWSAGNSATLTRDTTTCANGSACLKITNAGATSGYASVAITTVIGRVYKAALYIKGGTSAGGQLLVGTTAGAYDISYSGSAVAPASFTRIEAIFEAVGTTTHVSLYNQSTSGGTTYYDSITLYDMGANLVTNGTFNTNITGWTATHGTYTATLSTAAGINGNALTVAQTTSAGGVASCPAIYVTPGKLYYLSLWAKQTAGDYIFSVGSAAYAQDLVYERSNGATFKKHTALFEAPSSGQIYLDAWCWGTTGNIASFDSITLTEATVGCVDYTTKALDLWWKGFNTSCWRETINTKAGSYYALRVYNGAVYWADGGRSNFPEFYSKYAGRSAVIGMWIRCSSANKARIGISDSSGTTWSSYHSGGGSYEWLEVTRTPGTGITSFYISLDAGTSTEAIFSQPQLMFGSSIGTGNFVPIPGEWINFEQAVTIPSLIGTFSTVGSVTEINLRSASLAKLPIGLKSIRVSVQVRDTGSLAGDTFIFLFGESSYEFFANCSGKANGSYTRITGTAATTSKGNTKYSIGASGTNTFTVSNFSINGVQL